MSYGRRGFAPRPLPSSRIPPSARAKHEPLKEEYPYICVRLIAVVHQREPVTVGEGAVAAQLKFQASSLHHPAPWLTDGQVSPGARAALLDAVMASVRETGLRMCVVWGPAWCTFVESSGQFRTAFQPPEEWVTVPAIDLFKGR